MASEVYANGMEVSGKASTHQVIASMPDVCLSPPSPPAGPVPIPYPNFAQASDTTDGSKTVLAGGKEISLKGVSSYKKSTGDEAATKSLGMGTISHNITGPVKHKAGSFDVKVEGSDLVRHLDLTTGNHINSGNGATAPKGAKVAPPDKDPECQKLRERNEEKREETETADVSKSKKDAITGTGTTISSAKFTPAGGGRPTVVSAPNRNLALDACPGEFVAGGDMEDRHDNVSQLCPDAKHKHKGVRASGHAEARILDHIGGRPGKILFNVNLIKKNRYGKKISSRQPCGHCHRMMCAAKKCGMDVWLCDKDGNQKQMTDEHCPKGKGSNKPIPKGAREKLKKMIGGP